MRAANRLGYGFVAILGGEEIAKGEVTLKDMRRAGGADAVPGDAPARPERGNEARVARASVAQALRDMSKKQTVAPTV